jgi:hypothetical protein
MAFSCSEATSQAPAAPTCRLSAAAARSLAELRRQADALLDDAPSKYEIPDGKRLLATSRRVLQLLGVRPRMSILIFTLL